MSRVVIAWDEGVFADRFRSACGDNVSVVTSRSSLDQELQRDDGKDWGDTCLVVLLELDWEGHRSRFRGFDIVRDLLLHEEFDQPIVLCSFARKRSLYDIPGIGRRLARMPFTFERLPTTPGVLVEKARNAAPFSAPWLEFVRRNILVEKPYAMCAHDIRGAIPKGDEELSSAVEDALDDLDALNLGLPENLLKHRQRAEQALENERYGEARNALRVFVGLLEQHGVQEANTEDSRPIEEGEPKSDIILIEDEGDELEYYRRGLERDFNVFAARHVEEVLAELEENPKNREYVAIVADWRLKEEDGKTDQPLQGFELLDKVSRKHGPIYRVALTSLPKSAIASVQNATSSKIYDTYFPKGSVGNAAGYSFPEISEKIKEGIEPIQTLRTRLPEIGPWKPQSGKTTFREVFLKLYNSNEWNDELSQIKRTAINVIKDYVEYYENEYSRGGSAPPVGNAPYNLSAGEKATRDRVLKVLALRLVSLWFHFKYETSTEDICPFLTGKTPEYGGTYPGQWYSILGLGRSGGGFKVQSIFPYEEEWLKSRHNVNIKSIRQEKIDRREGKFVEIINDGLEFFRGTTIGGEKIPVQDRIDIRNAKSAVRSLENIENKLESIGDDVERVKNLTNKLRQIKEEVYNKSLSKEDIDMLYMLDEKDLLKRFDNLLNV